MATLTETDINVDAVHIRRENGQLIVEIAGWTQDSSGVRLRNFAFDMSNNLTAQNKNTLNTICDAIVNAAKNKLSII